MLNVNSGHLVNKNSQLVELLKSEMLDDTVLMRGDVK